MTDVVEVMKRRKGESLYVQAKHIVTTIETFMASADDFITSAHTPSVTLDEKSGQNKPIPHDMRMVSASYAAVDNQRLEAQGRCTNIIFLSC